MLKEDKQLKYYLIAQILEIDNVVRVTIIV